MRRMSEDLMRSPAEAGFLVWGWATFVPKGVMDGGKNTDARVLGVQVRGVMLKRDDE